ncbi:MAG: cell wall-binding repeat-containing protein [Eubacterium sp.]|nr:cell wall-binding repeat-containing protein [Eubacterium sp.]
MKQSSITRKLLAYILLITMIMSSVQFVFAGSTEAGAEVTATESQESEIPDSVNEKLHTLEEPHFAIIAMNNENGLIIEPHNIWFAKDENLMDSLNGSGHKFDNLTLALNSINGKSGNYVRYYDGDKYELDVKSEKVGAIVFTERLDEDIKTKEFQSLVILLADHRSKPAAERNFDDVKVAYEKALREIDTADKSKAVSLANELKAAYKKYNDWISEEKATVNFQVAQANASVSDAKIDILDKYGNHYSPKNSGDALRLNSGSYEFTVRRGENETSGSFEINAGEQKNIDVQLPYGQILGELKFMGSGDAKPVLKSEVSNSELLVYAGDIESDVYINVGIGESLKEDETGNYKVFAEYKGEYDGKVYGDETKPWTSIPWKSNNKKLNSVLKYGLEGKTVSIKAVHKLKNGYIQRQYRRVKFVRIPMLSKLKVSEESGNSPELKYDEYTNSYAVKTIKDELNFEAKTERSISGVKFGTAGEGYEIKIKGEPLADGVKKLPVKDSDVVDIEVNDKNNGQKNTYRINIQKIPAHKLTIKKDKSFDVELFSDTGAKIKPDETADEALVFNVAEGNYHWVSTIDKDYHAKGDIKVKSGQGNSFEAKVPKKEALLKGLSLGRNAAGNKFMAYELSGGKSFDWKNHNYKYLVPDYLSLGIIKLERADSTVSLTTQKYETPRGNTIAAKKWAANDTQMHLTDFIRTGGKNNEVVLTAYKDVSNIRYYQDYKIETSRVLSLNSLKLKNDEGEAVDIFAGGAKGFKDSVYEYTAEIPKEVSTVDLTFKFPGGHEKEFLLGKYAAKIRGQEYLRKEDGSELTAKVSLDPDKAKEKIEIEVINDDNVHKTYSIVLQKKEPAKLRFELNPADSRIFIKHNLSGKAIKPEADGSYKLVKGSEYTYYVTHVDYLSRSETFTVSKDEDVLKVKLEKAPVNKKLKTDVFAEWPYFRYDENNSAAVPFPTPKNANETTMYWATQFGTADMNGSLGCPIMVGGYLYNYSGKSILKFDSLTGEILKIGKMDGKSAFAINSPVYAQGMIFVGLENGGVQAFDAETLESLWIYKDPLKGQPNCPISYKDGYIYTGFWNKEDEKANFVCLSITDEDINKPDERKQASWVCEGNGFYWAGAYVGSGASGSIEIASKQAKTYVVVGSDNGTDNMKSYGELLSIDHITGKIIDKVNDAFVGDIRSSILFDKESGRYYFTTKGGYFCSIKLSEDGSFDRESIKTLYLSSDVANEGIPMSTSTPVIHNGRAYVGVSGSGQFSPYSGHNISVIDLKTNKIAYAVRTMGYPQTSGLLTTAYETKDDKSVYVYFFDNFTPGKLRVIKDKPGQTEPDLLIDEKSGANTYKTAPTLFTPFGKHAQYAICSPVADEYGNIYFKNDSSHLFMIGPTIKELKVEKKPNKTKYKVGEVFNAEGLKVSAVYSNGKTRDVTKYLSYSKNPLTIDDTELSLRLNLGKNMSMYQDKDGVAGTEFNPPEAIIDLQIVEDNYVAENKRLAGADRYETSFMVADELKKALNIEKFDAVIVANGDNYADALSGAYLAKLKNAPLLLVNERTTRETTSYIMNNLAPGKNVFLLGGTAVVPEVMRTNLNGKFDVKRLYGDDRFATNMAVLKEAGVNNEELLVCSGFGFADSLSASSTGRPILLVGNKLEDMQISYLKGLNTKKYTIIGYVGAVNMTVENQLKAFGDSSRVYGQDRYETSYAIAKAYFASPKCMVTAYGDNFPDGLCGGVLAEKLGAPLMLVNELNTSYASKFAKDNNVKTQIVLGGTRFISDKMVADIVA